MRAAIEINDFIASIMKDTRPKRTIYGKNFVMVQMYKYYITKYLYEQNNTIYIFILALVSKQQDTYKLNSKTGKSDRTIEYSTQSKDGRTIMIDEPIDKLKPDWSFIKDIPSGDKFLGLTESEYLKLIASSFDDKEFLQFSQTK
ncbi:hypothetical protein PVA17_19230 [Lysinibacillus sp. CNPSo 3705]|uniref:hypothetical protein n=1 Tax=Lysinibacillus sp. CNPSo 3705 TaxID=3028148 RepID=UPI00236368F2|nr:hypothetical protein [Lysinibacillus sp. CNPSo 3705]MDD1504875.1 hypothetical protein [Lysinibacillus sp. CNPSo 3705]